MSLTLHDIYNEFVTFGSMGQIFLFINTLYLQGQCTIKYILGQAISVSFIRILMFMRKVLLGVLKLDRENCREPVYQKNRKIKSRIIIVL